MKNKLVKITINLPEQLDKKVREYGETIGLNYTTSVIDLINRGLQQNDTINALGLIYQENQKKKNKSRDVISHFDM